MTAEMQIRLIDDNPEAQAAFNGDAPAATVPDAAPQASPETGTSRPSDTTSPQSDADDQVGMDRLTDQVERFADANAAGLDDVVFSVEDLTKQINEIVSGQRDQIDTDEHRRLSDTPAGEPADDEDAGKEIAKAVDSLGAKLRDSLRSMSTRLTGILSQTKTGRTILVAGGRIADAGRAAAGRVANSRAGQAIGSGLARVGIGTAGRAAAAGAGATAGGAGAAGAAAGTGLAAALGPVGVAAIAVAAAVGAAVVALRTFTGIVDAAGDGIADLSSDVAIGRAESQIAREFQRLDRAQRIGSGVAAVESAQDRFAQASYELQTKMLELLLRLEPVVEGVLDATTAGVRGVDLMVAGLDVVASRITIDPDDDQKADARFDKSATAFAKALGDILKDNDDQVFSGIDPIFQSILQADLDPKAINPPGPLPLS